MTERESANFFSLKTFMEKNISVFLRDVLMWCHGNSVQTLKEKVRNYRQVNNNNISNKDVRTIEGLGNNLKALKMDLLCKMFSAGICDSNFNNNMTDWSMSNQPPQGNDICFLADVKRLIWMWKKKVKFHEEDEELNENDTHFCWKMLDEISARASGNNVEEISVIGRKLLSLTQAERPSNALVLHDDENRNQELVPENDTPTTDDILDDNVNTQIGDNNAMHISLSGCHPSKHFFIQHGNNLKMDIQLVDLGRVKHIDIQRLGTAQPEIEGASGGSEHVTCSYRMIIHPRDPNNDVLKNLSLSEQDMSQLCDAVREDGLTIKRITNGCLIIELSASHPINMSNIQKLVEALFQTPTMVERLKELKEQDVMSLDWLVYYYTLDSYSDFFKEKHDVIAHFTIREEHGPIFDVEIHMSQGWYLKRIDESGDLLLRLSLFGVVVEPQGKSFEETGKCFMSNSKKIRQKLNEELENSRFRDILEIEEICSNYMDIYIKLAQGVDLKTLGHKDGPIAFLMRHTLGVQEMSDELHFFSLTKIDVFIHEVKHWCSLDQNIPQEGGLEVTFSTNSSDIKEVKEKTINSLLVKMFHIYRRQLPNIEHLDLVVFYGENPDAQDITESRKLDRGFQVPVKQGSLYRKSHDSFSFSGKSRHSFSDMDSQSDVTDTVSDVSEAFSTTSDRAIVYEDPEFESCEETMSIADSGYSTISEVSLYERSAVEYKKLEEMHTYSRKLLDDSELLKSGVKLSKEFKSRRHEKGSSIYPTLMKDVMQMESLLQTNTELYKKCSLEIVSAHNAVCTNLDENDDIKEIYISGRSKCNKAYGQDEVLVKVLDTGDKTKLTNYIQRLKKDLRKSIEQKNRAYGEVVGIFKRHRNPDVQHPVFVCTIDEFENHLARPICKTIPKIHLLNENCEKWQFQVYEYDPKTEEINPKSPPDIRKVDQIYKKTLILLVAVIHWESLYPFGAIIKVFDSVGDIKSSLDILKLQFQVLSLYRYETIKAVEEKVRNVETETKESDREDLSDHIVVVTIDPEDAYVLDDALSLEILDNNNYRVGIHISDVCSVVKKNDAIDNEARQRSVTFYPGPRLTAYHMLPEPICKDLCSLNVGEERNAISVFYIISSNGVCLEKPKVQKTKIRSQKQYTYDEVQSILSGNVQDDDNTRMLQTLSRFAKTLKQNRMKVSSLARSFKLDVLEDDDIETRAKDAYELVSEWMIFTNIFIANKLSNIAEYIPIRSQNPPDVKKVQQWMKDHGKISFLVMALQNYLITEEGTIRHLSVEDNSLSNLRYTWLMPSQRWLWAKVLHKNCTIEEKMSLLATDCLHPLQALAFNEWTNFQPFAEYRCVPSRQTTNVVHFGLQAPYYIHFTSPLRRYIDLVVQRMIVASLDRKRYPYTKDELDEICSNSNEAYMRSMQFQRNAKMFLLGHTLQKLPIRVHAFVQEVSTTEITVFIPGFRALPNSCISLPLNLLGSDRLPDVERNRDNGKLTLQLHWEKRIYSAEKKTCQREKHVKCQKLNPHTRSEFHHMAKWINALKFMINNPSDIDTAIFDPNHPNESNHRAVTECYDTVNDVNSETDIANNVKQSCEFTMTFSFGQVLSLQITGEPDQGMILPTIQLLDMTKSIRICLQHVNDPVGKLAHYATRGSDEWMNMPRKRRKRDKQENRILLEYIRTWMAIFHMETATVAAQEDSITINDICVIFESNRKGYFKLSTHFCFVRDIELSTIPSMLYTYQPDVEESSPGSDFLCIKCELSKNSKPMTKQEKYDPQEEGYFWIGHAKINEVDTKDKFTKVGFTLHKESTTVPTDLMQTDTGIKSSVEVLPKSDVDKRIEVILKNLELASPLAKAIALRRVLPRLGKERKKMADKTNIDIKCKGLPENNQSQRAAIRNALQSSFSMIQGPPGTGKTLTGIKLVYLFCLLNKQWREEKQEMKRVIFTGPSNKSVDLVAKWFRRHTKNLDFDISIARMYGGSLENIDYRIPGKMYSKRRSQRDGKPDPSLKSISVHHMIRKDGEKFAEAIKKYDEKFSKPKYKVDMKEINDYKKKINAAIQNELQKHDVIFCTTAVATSSRFLSSIQGSISQLIIDEAGMCTEPETVSTIVSTRAEQVVLIGDHKQLRPIVICQKAASLGLEKSLFEQYAEQNLFLTFLDTQYRMHERICEFPSSKFYGGKLKTAPKRLADGTECLRIFPNENIPLVLCHVEGEEVSLQYTTEIGNEASCSNGNEVEQVVKIFRHLVDKEKIMVKDICIMSQYNAQCHELRHTLKDTKDVQVNTVFASQGCEWDFVIFSTVRSLPEYRIEPRPTLGWCIEALGFITDEHQINVALTRAKKGLIIVGNKNLLCCETKVWKDLIDHYQRMGCIVKAEDFPKEIPRPKRGKRKSVREAESVYEFYIGTDMEEDLAFLDDPV